MPRLECRKKLLTAYPDIPFPFHTGSWPGNVAEWKKNREAGRNMGYLPGDFF